MKKRKSSAGHLILCLMMAFVLTVGLLPGLEKPVFAAGGASGATAAAATTGGASGVTAAAATTGGALGAAGTGATTGGTLEVAGTTGSAVLDAESIQPEKLEQYPEDVYDQAKKQPFLLSQQDELAVLVSSNAGAATYDTPSQGVNILDTIDTGMTGMDQTVNDAFINGAGTNNAVSSKKLTTDATAGWHCVQSIGIDVEGTGRKQYIASVGFSNSDVVFNVQNAVTGAMSCQDQHIAVCSEVMSANPWVRDNFVAITAGDYDGDGKDSVVIYVCGNASLDNNIKLMEYYLDGSTWKSRRVQYISNFLTGPPYLSDGNVKYKPAVSLATGDFNGDGRDQMAFSAGFYNTSGDVQRGYNDPYECDDLRQFATCVAIGSFGSNNKWSFEGPIWMYDKVRLMNSSGNRRTYEMSFMHAGAIAAGDVDNDGIDEIVAAGYTDYTYDESSNNYALAVYETDGSTETVKSAGNIFDFSKTRLVSSVIYRSGNGYERTDLQSFDMDPVFQSRFGAKCDDTDWVFAKISMACGKTNGDNNPEDVFINGTLYDFSSKTPQPKYMPSYLKNDLLKTRCISGSNSRVNWIRNVAAGNFNGDVSGREQFVFTFWQKDDSQDAYTAVLGVLAGTGYNDVKDDKGNVVSYVNRPDYMASSIQVSTELLTTIPDGSYLCTLKDNGGHIVPVAVDTDEDGVLGKYSQRGYVYTDPEVLAVLEASPFFGELDEAGGYSGTGTTTYTVTNGYGTSSSKTDSVSFEVGFAGEVSGGGVKVALETGYCMDWSRSFEKSYSVEQSVSFSAQSEDVVAIQRIPVLVYTYDIWDKTTRDWIKNGMDVKVPLEPRVYLLGIDEYNQFVDEYNSILDKGLVDQGVLCKLKKIGVSDLPPDHIGNPDKYWSNWSQAGNGAKRLSAVSANIDHSDGQIAVEYSESLQSSESKEIGHGFHFGLTVQGGGGFGSAGEFWAGGYTNMDYSHSTGYSTTKVRTDLAAGTVNGIKTSGVQGLTPAQLRNEYDFQWSFGKWTRRLDSRQSRSQTIYSIEADNSISSQDISFDNEVPFYGYVVTGVKRRALPPVLSTGKDTVQEKYKAFASSALPSDLDPVLTVTKISGDEKIDYDNETGKIKVAAGLPTGTHSAAFRISNGLEMRDTIFNYKVTVIDALKATASLKAVNQTKGVKLTWKKVTGAAGYKVYRGSKLVKTLKGASKLTCTDTGARKNGTKYTFKVVPYVANSNGPAKKVTTYFVSRPTPKLSTTSRKLKVSWKKNAKASGYQVWYSTSSKFKSGTKKVTVGKKGTVKKIFTAKSGKTYYVKIRTFKKAGSKKYYSAWSTVKKIKVK